MLRQFLSYFNFKRAIGELWKVLGAQDTPHRWRWMVVSALIPVSMFSYFASQVYYGPLPKPEVIYIQNWRADRTDAEIIAGNIAAAQKKAALEAADAQRAEESKQMYRTLGRMSGMDVDKIERDARAEQAAEAAAQAHKPTS